MHPRNTKHERTADMAQKQAQGSPQEGAGVHETLSPVPQEHPEKAELGQKAGPIGVSQRLLLNSL